MNTNKHESWASMYLHKATISILETIQLKGLWQAQWNRMLNNLKTVINNQFSCLLDLSSRLAKVGSRLINLSVFSLWAVVKNRGYS
jgi:hypothetical protein